MKENIDSYNPHFEQLIWRAVGPIRESIRNNDWPEITYEKAVKLLVAFDGKSFEEVVYHYERSNCIDLYQRKPYYYFHIKNFEFDLRKLVENSSQVRKIHLKKSNDYIEVRFLLKDGRLDLGFKNMI